MTNTYNVAYKNIIILVYTKTVDSVVDILWFTTENQDGKCYSPLSTYMYMWKF